MRLYTPDELGKDGYPPAWHETIKHQVREDAGHRCVRCLHPFPPGSNPEWSLCDSQCQHGGPIRVRSLDGEWVEYDAGDDAGPLLALSSVVKEARYRVLTVHHLTGSWGNEKDAKRDCRWWNLAALCQRCHLTIQGKVQMQRVWPWEHSDWFKPYVAGYYAFVYRGEDLDRPTVEGRLDELLGLERAA